MRNEQPEINRLDEEIEIDLKELLFRIKKRILLILLATFLAGGLGYTISKYVLTPVYTSTSIVYVLSKETTLTSIADLTIGAQLTEDYKVLITSRTVLESVINKLNLDMNYHALVGKISIENPRNTRILKISVKDADPELSKSLADATALSASDYIADIMEQNPPKIIESGEVPTTQTSPSNGRNAVLFALGALVLCIGVITVSMIMDDTIKTEDDIEKRFRLPVIAVVPALDDKDTKGKNRKARKRKGAEAS